MRKRQWLLYFSLGCAWGRTVVEMMQGEGTGAVVASIPVANEDGSELGMLEIVEYEEVADIIATFCIKHALPMWFRRAMVEKVCDPGFSRPSTSQCTRKRALLFEAPVSAPDPRLGELPGGPLRLWDDQNIQMTVHTFVFEAAKIVKENRSSWEFTMRQLEAEQKKRTELVEQAEGSARLREKHLAAVEKLQETNAKISEHLTIEPPDFKGDPWFEQALLNHVCALSGVECTAIEQSEEQQEAQSEYLPDMPISVGSGDTVGVIKARRGEEAADVAYRFARDHDMSEEFIHELRHHLCATSGYSCTREKALAFTQPISEILGLPPHQEARHFQVWAGQQAADAAYAFAPYDLTVRTALMAAACTSSVQRYVDCDRGDAVRYRFPVTEDSSSKGEIVLYEHQRPIDAVYEFCRTKKYLQPKYTQLKVRENLHRDFCASFLMTGLAEESDLRNCELTTKDAREKLFTVDFTVYEHAYSYRFYDDDFREAHEEYDQRRSYEPGALANAWNSKLTESSSPSSSPHDTTQLRSQRAAETFCARIWPPAQGCEQSLAPIIASQIARAKRRRYEIVSPFGYDYYLSLRELRDADNQTLRHAYLRELLPLPPRLIVAKSNISAINSSLDTAAITNSDAKQALASIRGRRQFLTSLLDDALSHLFLIQNDTAIAAQTAALAVQLTAMQTALSELQADLFDTHDLLAANSDLLCYTQDQLESTKPAIDFLEVQSRVLKEAADTLMEDPEKRATNDKPCEKIFGACCAKETANGGKDIKCGDNFDDV